MPVESNVEIMPGLCQGALLRMLYTVSMGCTICGLAACYGSVKPNCLPRVASLPYRVPTSSMLQRIDNARNYSEWGGYGESNRTFTLHP
jgi:hypothetical protein